MPVAGAGGVAKAAPLPTKPPRLEKVQKRWYVENQVPFPLPLPCVCVSSFPL